METRTIKGKLYALIVLRVETTLENDKPDTVSILRQDQVAELSDDESQNQFYTAWIPVEAI